MRQVLIIAGTPTPLPRRKEDLVAAITNLANDQGATDAHRFLSSFDDQIKQRNLNISNKQCGRDEIHTAFGNENVCPEGFLESTANCCRPVREQLFYIHTDQVVQNCKDCPITNAAEKASLVNQASKDERALQRDFADIPSDKVERINRLLAGTQKKAFNLMTDQFNEIFSLANVGECEDDVSEELLAKLRQDRSWLGKAWHKIKSNVSWFVKFTGNTIGYIFTLLYKFLSAVVGSTMFGKALTMAKTFAAYFVYSPQSTRVMLYIVKTQLRKVCLSVGEFLVDHNIISRYEPPPQASYYESITGFVSGIGALDGSRLSQALTKATGHAGKLIGGTLKGIPVVGGFLGSVTEVCIDVASDMTLDAAKMQLKADVFRTDIMETLKSLFEILDFRTCASQIPGLTQRYPFLALPPP
jgi:hypothetical protein